MDGTTTIRFAGFGGQGIVRAGEILGAAALADGKRALQNQSYGSAARGGRCTADVAVSDGDIYEIEPEAFDVVVALSQDACDAFAPLLCQSGGLLVIEEDLVTPPVLPHAQVLAIRATHIAAQELGRRIVTNMVVLGYCGALTGLVSKVSLERAIESNVPKGTEELNLRGFSLGWARGLEARGNA